MKELNDKGYIKYEPSFNPFKGSMVILFNFSDDLKPTTKKTASSSNSVSANEQAVNKLCTSSETGTEHVVGTFYKHNINNTNFSNNLNLNEQNFFENEKIIFEKVEKEKSSAKKEKDFVTPSQEDVKQFFQQNNFPELEAQKFFNYFSSNGWLVGGKTPMVYWQAGAHNWMLNFDKFNTTEPIIKTNHLTTTTDKNYAEPL